jgi:hypothetical protein
MPRGNLPHPPREASFPNQFFSRQARSRMRERWRRFSNASQKRRCSRAASGLLQAWGAARQWPVESKRSSIQDSSSPSLASSSCTLTRSATARRCRSITLKRRMEVSQVAQRRLAAEAADALQGRHEGLLDGLLRHLPVAQLGEGVAHEVRPVALDLRETRILGGRVRGHRGRNTTTWPQPSLDRDQGLETRSRTPISHKGARAFFCLRLQ